MHAVGLAIQGLMGCLSQGNGLQCSVQEYTMAQAQLSDSAAAVCTCVARM